MNAKARIILLWLICLLAMHGCEKKENIDSVKEKSIADHRYLAHVKASGINSSKIPQPKIDYRIDDTVFIYIEPQSNKIITVIIDKYGNVSDGIKP